MPSSQIIKNSSNLWRVYLAGMQLHSEASPNSRSSLAGGLFPESPRMERVGGLAA